MPIFFVEMYQYLLGMVVFYYLYRWYKEKERVSEEWEKYVYITGCDSGFGRLLARRLDALGFCVIASCITEKGEEDLKKDCSARLTAVHLDVTKTESVSKAAELIKTKVGGKGEFERAYMHSCTVCIVMSCFYITMIYIYAQA